MLLFRFSYCPSLLGQIAFTIYETANASGQTPPHLFTMVGGTAPMGIWSFGEKRFIPILSVFAAIFK